MTCISIRCCVLNDRYSMQ